MKKKRRWISCLLILILILSMSLSGCADEEKGSSAASTKQETSSGKKAKENQTAKKDDYNEKEIVNDNDADLSELQKNDISRAEAKKITDAGDRVSKAIRKYEKKYTKKTKLTPDNLEDYLYSLQDYLYQLNIRGVTYYSVSENYLTVEFETGAGSYIYSPQLEGMDAGTGNKKMQIATYQPFRSAYPESLDQYMTYPDDCAAQIDKEFDMYQFDDRQTADDSNYDDEEVTLENILNFGKNNIVFWHGHGGYIDGIGCILSTAVKETTENMQKYYDELEEGYLVRGESNGETYYCVTPAFFDHFLKADSLTNSIIYLGACSSGQDTSLIDTLISKGAAAVFANSATIYTEYNLKMMKSVADGMLKKDTEGYYTLDKALEYAQKKWGERDARGTETYLTYKDGYEDVRLTWYEDYKTSDRDVVLVLDRSGSMDDEPLDETKEAADKFIDTVFKKDSRVSLVTYSDDAQMECPLVRNKTQLKSQIDGMEADGGTNMYDGLKKADNLLKKSNAKKKIIVLMSDGAPNEGKETDGDYAVPLEEYDEKLKNEGYYIYTLGFFMNLEEEEYAAQSLMENIASPGLHYEVASAEDLVYFFDDIANQIGGEKYVYIRIACPVDVEVTSGDETLSSVADSENKRTSFGSLSYEDVESESQAKVLRLKMDEDYDINIQGYDEGSMDYTVKYPDDNGEYNDVREFPDITVHDGMKATSNTADEDSSYLKVDEDGDGSYEKTYETESNGEMKEVKDHTILYICIAIGVIAIIGLIILVIVIVRKMKSAPSNRGKGNADSAGAVTGLFGSFKDQTYTINTKGKCRIGREHPCEIRIHHPKVSRMHCEIAVLPDGTYRVTDYSSNGTFYENQRLEKGVPQKLPKGAVLVIGDPDNVLQLK